MNNSNITQEKRSLGLGLGSTLKNLDMFHVPIPGFNFNGREYLRTGAGGIISFIICYVTMLFAALKLSHLISKHNPQINTFVNPNAYNYDDVFNLDE